MSSHRFFATTPKGLESLLGAELTALGATELRETRAGVAFVGTLALAYRACLWSRLANRVLLPLDNFAAPSPEALYAGVHAIHWERHFGADHTLAVDFSTLQSQISHSHYGALKAKDAIVARFRARDGRRPSVERAQPDIRINVYLYRGHATTLWSQLLAEAHERRDIGLRTLPVMYGYDVERRAVQAATLNVAAAQLERYIVIEQRPLDALGAPAAPNRGLVMSNPPYGERLGDSETLANRLRKNLKQLERWRKENEVRCYRLYDADLPEYAVAVDVYHGDATWALVQEYAAPASVDPNKAETRLRDALRAVIAVLAIPRAQVFLKVRQQQKGSEQYQPLADTREYHEAREGPCRLLVNFTDYLDTGLFLDHRPVRAHIREPALGKQFLNLFAYTGSASVHAAAGGAAGTTTVDMSQTYLDWARRNMALNGYTDPRHRYIQADCLAWLAEQSTTKNAPRYDLIFLDPPTFSNSKRMSGTFDVQRDHVALILQAVELLAPGGALLFSTNFRRFKMDADALADLQIEDMSAAMLPRDFARDARIHQVWKIQRRD